MSTNMLDTSCMNNNTRPDSASRSIHHGITMVITMIVTMVATMIGVATAIVIITTMG